MVHDSLQYLFTLITVSMLYHLSLENTSQYLAPERFLCFFLVWYIPDPLYFPDLFIFALCHLTCWFWKVEHQCKNQHEADLSIIHMMN